MTKIFFNGKLVWNKTRLPREEDGEALELMKKYVEGVSPEAAEALSAGIDVRIRGNEFKVELNTDGQKW